MNDLDKNLQEDAGKLNGEADSDLGQEETLFQRVAGSFRGKQAWLTIVAWAYMFLFTGVAIFAAVRFFRAETTRDLILYATVFAVTAGMVMAVKMWYWMLLNRNSIHRQIQCLGNGVRH